MLSRYQTSLTTSLTLKEGFVPFCLLVLYLNCLVFIYFICMGILLACIT